MKRIIISICAVAATALCGCDKEADFRKKHSAMEVLKSVEIWEISKEVYYTEPDGKGLEHVSYDETWAPDEKPIGAAYEDYHFNDKTIRSYYMPPFGTEEWHFPKLFKYYEEYGYEYDDITKTISLIPLISKFVNSERKQTMKIHAYGRDKVTIEINWQSMSHLDIEYNYKVLVLRKSDRTLEDFNDYADFDTYRKVNDQANEDFMNSMQNGK